MLGSQLGVGAYRALFEEKLNGVMVSVSGQLDLHYVPFSELGRSRNVGDQSTLYREEERLLRSGPGSWKRSSASKPTGQ